ncbi:MAG: glycosyltransferase family 4 protein [Desulfofustis sp.]|nr:glycosyltransferase family 4 protein [Desulfofustis sp.]
MNILHVISQHPESTGSGIYLQHVLRQAARAGHTSYLVAGWSGGDRPELTGVDAALCRFIRFGDGDLDFAIPGMSDVMPYRSCRFRDLSPEQLDRYETAFAGAVAKAARDFPIDVVHTHHLWLATAVTRRTLPGYPLVTSCHSTDLRQLITCPHLRGRIVPDCRGINRVLALDPGQVERISSLYGITPDQIAVAGAGIDRDCFSFADKQPVPPVHLLYAGKISLAKGVDWLLRVFAGLRDPAVHLHLAGSGHGRDEHLCRQLAAACGDRVTLHGPLSQPVLAGLMRRCHIFVLPSFYEGLPLVLLEALASGCRLVATDLPGCRHLLDQATEDLVDFVELPAMTAVDRPDDSAWRLLDGRLATALRNMIDRTGRLATPRQEDGEACLAGSAWQEVFARISAAYDAASQSQPAA